ncbi:kynureninase [Nonlabens xylanidelens]|uniref:Kynureninase n=1 Tax=Nonlabens xylanidelens TaxID=191564 RepID=A0A2S6IPL9_9FLAO|nr:kynureninase [Nonlabens xylanidelens]PPK96193.1 kynureninase [Nonlabens xylanidelens]PQJ17936.1 kynureninase [Nonlabens xylanidelens]
MTYKTDHNFALQLDQEDSLSRFRESFHIPKHKDGTDSIYLCGNSLGLQPRQTKDFLNKELEDWANLGVEGHFHAKHPWMPYHEFLTETTAQIVGAKPHEVVIMNTLTTNLHLMMVSFYQPKGNRTKILIEGDAFPSDRYAVASQIKFHGGDPETDLITWQPRPSDHTPSFEDLEVILKNQGDEIALVMIGAVNYYTGQLFELKKIADLCHSYGIMVGYDCAHGAGNVDLQLHDSGADFAVWCTYKYMNAGPGSLGGCFVHERHADNADLPRFTGWWGHNKDTRFKMRDDFEPMRGAEGWQLSNPPILSMVAIRASLDLFAQAGFENLREKSIKMTNYLEFLLQELDGDRISIITPSDSKDRGCQLSLAVKNADRSLFDAITAKGVIADWREPDVIRIAPVPLYNNFEDCWRFVDVLKSEL